MPTYQYRCRECKRETEAVQRITDPPLEQCEECKGKVERLIPRTHFELKGGGWFKDGY
jgi:putative FmdB family regulatory protein